jgi:lysophospholipase L1-like esterase
MTYEAGVWSPWRLMGAGIKNVAVALTTSGPVAVSTQTAVHGRAPFKIAVDANRFRIHYRNYNYRQWLSYPGSLSFLGASYGEAALDGGELTGQFKTTPTNIMGALTTNEFATEWATPWINAKLKANTPYLFGYAYNSPAQDNFASVGGGWLSSTTSALNSQTDGTLAKTKQLPLDMWIEVEVDARTRVIAYMGDSLTCGVSADLPVYDSWANRHALKQGALPMMYGFSGDGFNGYVNSAQPKLIKWAAQARPDTLVCALGSNNIFQGTDLTTTRDQMKTALDLITAVTCNNLYLTTILPRFAASSAWEANRKAWNEILKTELPYNAVACFEAAEKFTDSSGDLLDVKWAASSTDFHLNRAGYARFAAQVPAL